ncbi:hypothetical protein GCM10010483_69190 [Actinokineospora diospyrosa]
MVLVQRRFAEALQHPSPVRQAGGGQGGVEVAEDRRHQVGERDMGWYGEFDAGGRPANGQPAHLAGTRGCGGGHAQDTGAVARTVQPGSVNFG